MSANKSGTVLKLHLLAINQPHRKEMETSRIRKKNLRHQPALPPHLRGSLTFASSLHLDQGKETCPDAIFPHGVVFSPLLNFNNKNLVWDNLFLIVGSIFITNVSGEVASLFRATQLPIVSFFH